MIYICTHCCYLMYFLSPLAFFVKKEKKIFCLPYSSFTAHLIFAFCAAKCFSAFLDIERKGEIIQFKTRPNGPTKDYSSCAKLGNNKCIVAGGFNNGHLSCEEMSDLKKWIWIGSKYECCPFINFSFSWRGKYTHQVLRSYLEPQLEKILKMPACDIQRRNLSTRSTKSTKTTLWVLGANLGRSKKTFRFTRKLVHRYPIQRQLSSECACLFLNSERAEIQQI